VSKEKRKELEEMMALMSPDSSYKNYRAAFRGCNPPSIPYIGVSLTDLTFIEEGNPDILNGQINFKKRELAYKVIQEVVLSQTFPYQLFPVEPLHTFVQELAYNSSDDELYDLSLYVEPREAEKKK